MKQLLLLSSMIGIILRSFGQENDSLRYIVTHTPPEQTIEITINFNPLTADQVRLIIPRSAPSTYNLTDYILFVEDVKATTTSNEVIYGTKGIGSYFEFPDHPAPIRSIRYTVDIDRMEKVLVGAFASSKLRENYLGILGYSVFGFPEGFDSNPITLTLQTAPDWPIFSTLRPAMKRRYGKDTYPVMNYEALADAQYLLGTDVLLWQAESAPIPFYVAVYAETAINIREIGRRGLASLEGLADYFGFLPMPHYTLCYEFLIPLSSKHEYGAGMEHLNSMTSSSDTSRAIVRYDPEARLGYLVHHIGHSWIPLRSYGKGYRPFEWQTAPLMETIWFNEGFIWYIAYYRILNRRQVIDFFRRTIDSAPDFIQRKSLKELSLLGSTQYSKDFRIGRNLFSRGALLAYDLDEHILKTTNGQKSLKDALLALYEWTRTHHRGFDHEEIRSIIENSLGIDIAPVWDKWQGPLSKK